MEPNRLVGGLLLLALAGLAPTAAALHALPAPADLPADAPTAATPLERLLRVVAEEETAREAALAADLAVSDAATPPVAALPSVALPAVKPASTVAVPLPRAADPLFTCRSTEPLTLRLQDMSDPGIGILFWKWEFGDGAVAVAHTSSDNPEQHRYARGGTYEVALTIRTADGLRAVATRACEVLSAIVPAAVPPAPPAPPAQDRSGATAAPVGQAAALDLVPAAPAASAPGQPAPRSPATRVVPVVPPPLPAPQAAVAANPAGPDATLVAAVVAVGAAAALAAASLGPRLLRFLPFLPLVGLFTRLREDELLEHPVRRQVVEAVTAEPGIHYQALVRTLEKGNGVLEHHLRMLVQGGLVKERHAGGYTCYFPAATDRRLMDVHAVLKSDVARRVLDALVARPGDPIGHVARSVGVTPKAVTYHLSRFQDAGLVRLEKVGRTVQAYANPIALQVPRVAVATA